MQEQGNTPSAAVPAFASRPGKTVLRPAGLLVLVLLVFAAAGCGKVSPGGGAGAQSVYQPDPLQVRIEFSKAVALYDPVEVKVTLKGNEKLLPVRGDVKAVIKLPSNAAYINGQLRWEGQIAPGESKQFTATIAFVAEGHSWVDLTAGLVYSDPDTNQTSTFGPFRKSVRMRAAEKGGEIDPSPVNDEPSYNPGEFTSYEPGALINRSGKQRVFMATGGGAFDEIQRQGLSVTTGMRGFGEGALHLLLFDKQRETTGYHLAVLQSNSGATAYNLLGLPFSYEGPSPVVVDVIAIEPRNDWPVEKRQVSQAQAAWVPWAVDAGKPMELFIRVNGQLVHRQVVVNGRAAVPVEELTSINIVTRAAK